jgi:hypothetical protein
VPDFVPEKPVERVAPSFFAEPEEDETFVADSKKRSQGKSRRRQLVYDEDAGEVVARRKRKSSRKRSSSYLDELDDEF